MFCEGSFFYFRSYIYFHDSYIPVVAVCFLFGLLSGNTRVSYSVLFVNCRTLV